ncbi:hypothetical protein caldi_06920 [Caldinitratiruptor microaerophilus]|uniref:Uncharacterized protein n=1 Tax=Caldinitratiruptor microaerophilus TaxID=671077 RepID=A0AA35CIH5_9FIRM|nr:hypothetical protein caldi_06920 [Caldinitratiruptor microaerophilus]
MSAIDASHAARRLAVIGLTSGGSVFTAFDVAHSPRVAGPKARAVQLFRFESAESFTYGLTEPDSIMASGE